MNGFYITENGSTLQISGKHSGIFAVEFDWLEEGGCPDCHPNATPEHDSDGMYLTWDCDECDGGRAKWHLDLALEGAEI